MRGSRPRPSRPRTSLTSDWLRFEREKHQRLLAALAQRTITPTLETA